MDLVKFLSPRHVILVHGEKPKMASLKERIHSELGIQCYDPANNEIVCIPSSHYVKAAASDSFLQSCLNPNFKFQECSSTDTSKSSFTGGSIMPQLQVKDERATEGILVVEKSKRAKVLHQDELLLMLGETKHDISLAYCCPVHISGSEDTSSNRHSLVQLLYSKLYGALSGGIQNSGDYLQLESFRVSLCLKHNCPHRIQENHNRAGTELVYFCCIWSAADDKLAWKVIAVMENLNLNAI